MNSFGNTLQQPLNQLKVLITEGSGFDPSRWDHWLVIGCYLVVAIAGLWLSWQWRQKR